VFTSYIVEATLITIYLAFHLLRRRPGPMKKWFPYEIPDRIVNAFRGSTYELFGAAVILNIGFQIFIFRQTIENLNELEFLIEVNFQGVRDVYEDALLRLVSAFVFFPVLALVPMLRRKGRRRTMILGVMGLLWILFAIPLIAGVILGENFFGWFPNDKNQSGNLNQFIVALKRGWFFDTYCSDGLAMGRGLYQIIMVCVFFYLILPIVWAIAAATPLATGLLVHLKWPWLRIALGRIEKVAEVVKRNVRPTVCIVGLIGMWSTLATLAIVRYYVVYGATWGDGDIPDDDEWDFTQVIAVATFAPVVVEFIYIACCESSIQPSDPWSIRLLTYLIHRPSEARVRKPTARGLSCIVGRRYSGRSCCFEYGGRISSSLRDSIVVYF
jgi:hypothetical protein